MLELKGVEAVSFYMCGDGKIGIKQFSTELMTSVNITITLDQFNEFEKWVNRNEFEINEGWNNGVEL